MKKISILKSILALTVLLSLNYSCKNDDDNNNDEDNDNLEIELEDVVITTEDCNDIIELSNFIITHIEKNDDDEIEFIRYGYDITNLTTETLSIGNVSIFNYISTDNILDDNDDTLLNGVSLDYEELAVGETNYESWRANNISDYTDLEGLFLFIEVDFENIPCVMQISFELSDLETIED